MRKLIASIAVFIAAALASCSSMAVMADEPDFTGEGSIVYLVSALGDMSFNDSGEEGMKILRKAGYRVKTIEVGTDASKYLDTMYDVLDNGYDYLVACNTFQEEMEETAPDYPDTKFIMIDSNPKTTVASDNILYMVFKQYESSYLGGIIAAGLSRSGAIGAIGGIENPVIKDFVIGYVQGAISYNPDIKVSVSWVENWTNTAKMKEICDTQNSRLGVDVFFPIAGGASTGAFEAASEIRGSWALGVDSDQYAAFINKNESFAKVIPTSVTKEVGNTLVRLFRDPSTIEWGTVQSFGLSEDAVGLVKNEYYEEVVPQEVRDAVDKATEDIKDGTIVVKSYYDGTESDYSAIIHSVK